MKIIKKLLNLLDRIEIVNEKGEKIFNNSTNKPNHRVIKIEIK